MGERPPRTPPRGRVCGIRAAMGASTTSGDLQGSASAIVAALPKVAMVDAAPALSVADADMRRMVEENHLVLLDILDELRSINARSNQ